MTLLLASGIGSGVLVIPRAMASVGYIPAALYFFIGALVSGATTWVLSLAVLEVRRIWLEEELKHPLHSSERDRRNQMHLAVERYGSPTTWRDTQQQPDDLLSPMTPSIRRSTSFRDFVTKVGPSYGDLVERATPECPWVSSTLDCVLFLHNTLALTVYFLFVSESYERLGWMWPLNRFGEPYTHVLTIFWTAFWGCLLSTLPTVGALARWANASPFVLWLMMGSIWFEWLFNWHEQDEQQEPETYVEDWLERSPSVLCIAVFASFWHTNCVAIAREFQNPTKLRLCVLSFASAFLLGLLYYFLAVGGYFTFGAKLLTAPNIVTLYGQADPFFIAVRLGLAFSLTIAIPLNVFPIRESVENMQLFRKLPTGIRRRLLGPATDPKMQATREHEIVGVTLVLIPMILSLCFRNVVQLITILGGSLVSLMMIVFPCIVFRMICPSSLLWWTTLMIGISFATFLALASWGFVGEKV